MELPNIVMGGVSGLADLFDQLISTTEQLTLQFGGRAPSQSCSA